MSISSYYFLLKPNGNETVEMPTTSVDVSVYKGFLSSSRWDFDQQRFKGNWSRCFELMKQNIVRLHTAVAGTVLFTRSINMMLKALIGGQLRRIIRLNYVSIHTNSIISEYDEDLQH